MNKATKICNINDITFIEFNSVNRHQLENDGISFEHVAKKFRSKSVSFSSKSEKW